MRQYACFLRPYRLTREYELKDYPDCALALRPIELMRGDHPGCRTIFLIINYSFKILMRFRRFVDNHWNDINFI